MLLFLIVALLHPAYLAAAPTQAMPSASSLMPLDSSRRTMVFTEGPYEGKSAALAVRQAEDPGVWLLKLGDLFEVELLSNDSSDLVLRTISSPREETVISYSPPVILLPATLQPATSREQVVEVSVADTKTGETTYRSSVTHRLLPPSRTTFYTPGGDYEGYQINVEQRGTFGLTTIEASFSAGFVPEAGLIHATLTYTTDRPLFFGDRHSHIAELAEPLPQSN